MAEMSSMAPSSGGQYHWVSEFAPLRAQKYLSYFSGWLSALGWQAFIAVAAYQGGELILVLASVSNPSYTPQPWFVRPVQAVPGDFVQLTLFHDEGKVH